MRLTYIFSRVKKQCTATFFLMSLVGFSFVYGQQTKTYTADQNTDIMNPDRGWHKNVNFIGGGNYAAIRSTNNMTLTRSYVRLDNYRNSSLPQSLLDEHTLRFSQLRQAGIKIVLRYAYNFSSGAEDAPLSRVLEHIEQLKPYWIANADVISVLQAGFIGAWGEWHSSTNNLTSTANRQTIANALLNALPESRMIQIRTPDAIRGIYPTPLAAAAAFTQTPQSRVGLKNDSFLRNYTDAGTYSLPPDYIFDQNLKNYAIAMSPYAVMGGETVEDVTWTEGNRQSCTDAPIEMALLNWDYLNRDYAASVITPWVTNGCYDQITRKLGYRLRLVSATLPTNVSSGGTISVSLAMANDGWGKVYNQRRIDLVLRHQTTNAEYRIILSSDARKILPRGGVTSTLNLSGTAPTIPAGQYNLFLHLPDPSPSISARPEYSIHLANTSIWEASTGYHNLNASVLVGTTSIMRPALHGVTHSKEETIYDISGRRIIRHTDGSKDLRTGIFFQTIDQGNTLELKNFLVTQ